MMAEARPIVTVDPRRNRRVAALSGLIVVAMVGLAYASVPLYRMFCQATGYGGTTQRAEKAPATAGTAMMTVRFDANVSGGLYWSFKPAQVSMDVREGEQSLAFYRVTNLSDKELTGSAVFNVTPDAAGAYFSKIQCFCFTEQTLKPHASADLPVVFYVDPAITKDPDVAKLTAITLSYTFYPASAPAAVSKIDAASPPVN